MSYTDATKEHIEADYADAQGKLEAITEQCILHGQQLAPGLAREHMLHGAGRRLRVIRRAIENIWDLFPLSTTRPLPPEDLAEIDINLHAFLMSLYGVMDNLAWAFVLRHDLLSAVGGKVNVGLFSAKTQRFMPSELVTYLKSQSMVDWQKHYVKHYRDALAHRIPPYVPPAVFSVVDSQRFNELNDEEMQVIHAQDFNRAQEIREQKQELGQPVWAFMHAFSEDEPPKPIMLHAQLVCDGLTLAECISEFFKHWHETAKPQVAAPIS